MKKLMNIVFLSCLKATELIEKSFHFSLSKKEKIQLKMHTSMCKSCLSYEKQSVLIEKGISNIKKPEASLEDIKSLQNKITKKIDERK